jgi:hypothetical protein
MPTLHLSSWSLIATIDKHVKTVPMAQAQICEQRIYLAG